MAGYVTRKIRTRIGTRSWLNARKNTTIGPEEVSIESLPQDAPICKGLCVLVLEYRAPVSDPGVAKMAVRFEMILKEGTNTPAKMIKLGEKRAAQLRMDAWFPEGLRRLSNSKDGLPRFKLEYGT